MVATIALTATATEDVRLDIIRGLELREPRIVITGFDRPNLSYQCRRVAKLRQKDIELLELLHNEPGSTIVYCATRKTVDELSVFGLLRHYSLKRVIAMVHRVIESGLARQRNVSTTGSPVRGVELTAAGLAVMRGQQPPPASLVDLLPRAGSQPSLQRPATIGLAADESESQMDPGTLERLRRLGAARLELARQQRLPRTAFVTTAR